MPQKELFKLYQFWNQDNSRSICFFSNKAAEIFLPLLPIINSVSGHEADEPTA